MKNRLKSIKESIALSAEKVGKTEKDITLVAVSKTHSIEEIDALAAAGQTVFGENQVQELLKKYEQRPDYQWHMIGRLQRNKVKYIAPFISLIHSVDSERLLAEINRQAIKNKRKIPCLIQLNISEEKQKGGLSEATCLSLLENMPAYPGIDLRGFMGMASLTTDKALIRSQFKSLKTVRDRFKAYPASQYALDTLSMGMSGDYQIAIEEGATMIRIGSLLFGSRATTTEEEVKY